ncbi:MAG: hypothetical protein M1837_004327 [Sclerophora amabilis]|nr:MAG: hypothetical protein M1837_004327 [Sclerophora amabilis]
MMRPCSNPLPANDDSWRHLPVEFRPRDFSPSANGHQRFLTPNPKQGKRRLRNSFDDTPRSSTTKNIRSLFFTRKARSTPCSDTEEDDRYSFDLSDAAEDDRYNFDLSNLCPPPQTPDHSAPSSRASSPRSFRAASPCSNRAPSRQSGGASSPQFARGRSPPSPGSDGRDLPSTPSQLIWLEAEQMWFRMELPPPTSPRAQEHHQVEERGRPDGAVHRLPSPRQLPAMVIVDDVDAAISREEAPPDYVQSQWEEAARRNGSRSSGSRWETVGARNVVALESR